MPKNPDLSRHLAMITGAAGGIGLEFAKMLARYGASLILVDIDSERLAEAQKTIEPLFPVLPSARSGAESFVLPLDLTSPDLVEKIESFCKERGIFPDILINNAGIFSFKPITDTETKKIKAFIDLHIRAVTELSAWFASRRKEKGEGWMLNMSSMSCWMPMPGLAMYASTKSYIRVFSRSLHYEMKDYGVGVTVACPGGISTDLFGLPEKWKKFAVAIGVLQTPEKFVKKAVVKMMKKKKQYINGWLNRFSIFFVATLPTPMRMLVKHKLLDRGITR